MAAPNLIGATTINGKSSGTALSSTSEIQILDNASASGKALKVNTILVSNSNNGGVIVTVSYHSAASLGGTAYPIVANVTIPGNSTLTVLDKTVQLYLEENTSLGATAGTANYLNVLVAYEDIS